jgi:ketosteroid isomerase-like protein
MADDETRIRELVERWARAVHEGDLDAVLADHAEDIVMFDVPPPEDGVRGIDAYRETWPAFFDWQRRGAVFDIVSLQVTAGSDVAFAHALLRCGTEEELAQAPRPPEAGRAVGGRPRAPLVPAPGLRTTGRSAGGDQRRAIRALISWADSTVGAEASARARARSSRRCVRAARWRLTTDCRRDMASSFCS